MGCLYQLMSPSGKSYIGISRFGLEKRWAKHVEHAIGKRSSGALYGALRKYGPDTFVRGILRESDNWEELCQLEKDAILIHGTLAPHGYNLTHGGEGTVGPRSEAARAAISIAQKKRFSRPEERAKNAARVKAGQALRWLGHVPVPRKSHSQNLSWEEHSRRTREAMAKPDVAAKVQACALKRSADPNWRAKISASKTGTTHVTTEAGRKAISEARKREWADPVMRAKRLAAFKKAKS